MSEKPILFSGPMVRAILDNQKTMTRRLSGLEDVNSYPGSLCGSAGHLHKLGYRGFVPADTFLNARHKRLFAKRPKEYHWLLGFRPDEPSYDVIPVRCPYGQPGDTLWVRETWASSPFRNIIKPRDLIPGSDRIEYRATYPNESHYSWRPSIHMPRWASRINLLVKSVRVERLQDISEEDAMAEGINPLDFLHMVTPTEVKTMKRLTCFELAWDSIYGKKYPWEGNWWVWVIGFEIEEVKP